MLAGVVTPLDNAGKLLAKVSILAFWSMDALKNSFAIESRVRNTAAHNLALDIAVIGIMTVVLSVAATLALRRKDSL